MKMWLECNSKSYKTNNSKKVKSLIEDELKRITHNVVQRVIKEKFEDLIQKEVKRITQNIIRNILNEKLSPF